MKFLLLVKYSWPGINSDIENFVKNCSVCARSGPERINSKNRMIRSSEPNELCESDLIGRVPLSGGISSFIFTAIEHFSKWVEARVVDSKDSATIARCTK